MKSSGHLHHHKGKPNHLAYLFGTVLVSYLIAAALMFAISLFFGNLLFR